MLAPRRSEGARRHGGSAPPQPGRAQPRARGVARLRQYERADGNVCARTAPRARTARQGADDCLRAGFHLRRVAARSRVIFNIVILALVTLERLGELWLAKRNTRRLLAEGPREHAPGHYPLIVALHAAWLGALWWFAPSPPIAPLSAAIKRE